MSQPIIAVEGLGKKYLISHQQEGKARYHSLRETMVNGVRGMGRRLRRPFARMEGQRREEFWALRDMSFEVQPGEVVGIIGRNGAGKSTLLKILSRITEPTTGQVTLRGRVASLLEVGTGFHPELSGRENVYLNGTILGMSRAEIRKKFDEIVAFAEVEKFLDTPVKRYSSGMYMRLAFAIAAHLEPEILIVDEVLAVGDLQFQKRCLGKMNDVSRSGRTVLIVSHIMQVVSRLCTRCICVSEGRIVYTGETIGAIERYHQLLDVGASDAFTHSKRAGSGSIRFLEVRSEQAQYRPEEPKRIRFSLLRLDPSATRCFFSGHLVDENEQIICKFDSRFVGVEARLSTSGLSGTLIIRLPWLKPGNYTLDLYLVDGRAGIVDQFEKACQFQVLPVLPYLHVAPEGATAQAAVLADFDWELEYDNLL